MTTALTHRILLVLTILAALLAVDTTAARTAVPDPETDSFYRAPSNLSSLSPGTLIRKRQVAVNLVGAEGLGVPMPGTATQVLVRSTDAKGRPAAVAATVITPRVGVRHELLAYQPATDSLGAKCEPSYALRAGEEKEAAVIALAVGQGLTVVVPDHQGPRHAYAAGRMAGHAVLDSIRGALKLPEASVEGRRTEVAMVGYSGGAIATGWAAQLQPSYAPRLNVVGVASGGTPGDLEAAGDLMDGSLAGGLFVAAAIGVSREYPELLTLLNERGRELVRKVQDYCNTDFVLRYPFASIKDYSDHPDPLRSRVAQEVLAKNKMGRLAPTAPYLLWHSRWDQLIPYRSAQQLRRDWCARGTEVKFVTDYLSEHVVGAGAMALDALPWLLDRYAGKPMRSNCP